MNEYSVKVRYTFEGRYYVTAESEQQARQIVGRDCGLVMGGGIHTSNPDRIVGWQFATHPETKIRSAKRIKPKTGRA